MRLIRKTISTDFMHFFVGYYKTLQFASAQDRYWGESRVFVKIDYVLGKYMDGFLETGEIPTDFINAEYYEIEETSAMLPPSCQWVSKSGRFSCHDLYDVLGVQSYILWDINRKVALPLLFNDLVGIDEKNEIIFCRTLGNFHFAQYNSPLRINLEWIDMLHYGKSCPDDYDGGNFYELSEHQQENIVTQGIINIERNDKDISSLYYLPVFEELLLKNIKLLVRGNLAKDEELNLITLLRTHPNSYEILSDVLLLSKAINKCTNDRKLHDLIKKKFYPIEDGLPL